LPKVSNSNYITSDWLLRRVEWTYTKGFPLSSKPRIGLLIIWKLGDEDTKPYVVSDISDRRGGTGSKAQTIAIGPHSDVVIHDPHSLSTELYADQIQQIMVKCNDEEILNGDKQLRRKRDGALDELNETHCIEVVYNITCFEMSDAIIRLCVCGSSSAGQFSSAMQYYSLWDTDPGAVRPLNKMSLNPEPEAKTPERSGDVDSMSNSPAYEIRAMCST
jgi:hypothetical protein